MNRSLILILIIAFIFCTTAVSTLLGQDSPQVQHTIERLRSSDGNVRNEVLLDLDRERSEMIKRLIAIIDNKTSKSGNIDYVRDAMTALATIHASEAVESLVKHIGYPLTIESKNDEGPNNGPLITFIDSDLPAVEALVKIGEPSVDAVITKLKISDNEIEQFACVTVLRRVNSPFVRERLQQTAKAASGKEKEFLNSSLKVYDEWTPIDARHKKLKEDLEKLFPNK